MITIIKLIAGLIIALVVAVPVLASETTGILTNGTVIVVVSPTANPMAGTYTTSQNVSLSASGSQSIHYTINGTEPNCASGFVYGSMIAVNSTTTIKGISCYANNVTSAVASFVYTITPPSAPTPTPTPSGGGGGGGGGAPASLPTPSGPANGDANSDSRVDLLDFNVFIINFGVSGTSLTGDFNGDGVVDLLDFNILVLNWTS